MLRNAGCLASLKIGYSGSQYRDIHLRMRKPLCIMSGSEYTVISPFWPLLPVQKCENQKLIVFFNLTNACFAVAEKNKLYLKVITIAAYYMPMVIA